MSQEPNWLLHHLARAKVGVRNGDGVPRLIAADGRSIGLLRECISLASRPGTSAILLPSCRAEVPVFAGLAVAWDLAGNMRDRRCAVLVTRQPNAAYMANSVWCDPPGPRQGKQAGMLDVATSSRKVHALQTKLEKVERFSRVRLVVADNFGVEELAVLQQAGLSPRAVIWDARTVEPPDEGTARELSRDIAVILLTASAWQIGPPFALTSGIAAASDRIAPPGAVPLLVTPEVGTPQPVAVPVTDPTERLFPLLGDVANFRGDPAVAGFMQNAESLRILLAASSVLPHELCRTYLPTERFVGHPVVARMDAMDAFANMSKSAAAIGAMKTCLIEFRDVLAGMTTTNHKRDKVIALARANPGSLVIVKNEAVKGGLVPILEREAPGTRVVSWNDPPVWAPAEGVAILTCPPHGRAEWVLNTPIGREVHLVLCPSEARFLSERIRRRSRTGQGHKVLEAIASARPAPPRPSPAAERPLDLARAARLLDSLPRTHHEEGGSAGIADQGEPKAMVRAVKLADGSVYYARVNSLIAAIRGGAVKDVLVGKLIPGEAILLPAGDPSIDIQEAVFRAAEEKPANREHSRGVRAWKAALRDLMTRKGWNAEQLAAELVRTGAGDVHADKLKGMLGLRRHQRETQIGVVDDEALIRACGVLLGNAEYRQHPERLAESITRLRGVHQNAGRAMVRVAEAGFLSMQDELEQVIDPKLGISHEELRRLVRPFVVTSVSEPFEVPGTVAGFVSMSNGDEA